MDEQEKKSLQLATSKRLAEAADVLDRFEALPVIILGVLVDEKKLCAFGFSGQQREEMAGILRDYLDYLEGGENFGGMFQVSHDQ